MIGINPYNMHVRDKLLELDRRFISHNQLENMVGGSRVRSHILSGMNPVTPIEYVKPTSLSHHSSVMMDGGYMKGSPSRTRRGVKDFTTKKGSLVHHIKGHYVKEEELPFQGGRRKPPSFKNVFKDIKEVGAYLRPVTKPILGALTKKAVQKIEGAGRRKPPSFKNVFNDIKEVGRYVKPVAQPILKAITGKAVKLIEGAGRSKSARASIVKKVMAEQGLSMIEASKYVKQHGLY